MFIVLCDTILLSNGFLNLKKKIFYYVQLYIRIKYNITIIIIYKITHIIQYNIAFVIKLIFIFFFKFL